MVSCLEPHWPHYNGVVVYLLICPKTAGCNVNSEDIDQMKQSVAFNLGLHYLFSLSVPVLWVTRKYETKSLFSWHGLNWINAPQWESTPSGKFCLPCLTPLQTKRVWFHGTEEKNKKKYGDNLHEMSNPVLWEGWGGWNKNILIFYPGCKLLNGQNLFPEATLKREVKTSRL